MLRQPVNEREVSLSSARFVAAAAYETGCDATRETDKNENERRKCRY